MQFQVEKLGAATLLLHQRAQSNSLVKIDDKTSRVVDFLERPTEAEKTGAVNLGELWGAGDQSADARADS